MRSNLDDNKGQKLDISSLRFGTTRQAISGTYTIPADGPILHFLDGGASDRDVVLPALKRGAVYAVINYGASNSLIVKTPAGATLATLTNVQGAFFVSSKGEWRFLANSVGTASALTAISSPNGTIDFSTIANVVTADVHEALVDHDLLLHYVANQHIDHTAVSIGTAANSGLAGGGTIAATRALSLDLLNLTIDTPTLADYFGFGDASGSDTNRALLSTLNGILDHDAFLNFVANKHINHTSVSVNAGTGLSGGGDISATRTISFGWGAGGSALTADTPVSADLFVFYDVSGADYNVVTLTNLATALGIATGAPTNADYLVKTANGSLSAELVATDAGAVAGGTTWDFSTPSTAKLLANAATATVAGVSELATSAETVTGTDTTRTTTPAGVLAAIKAIPREWMYALSDETTGITSSLSVPKLTVRAPYAFTLAIPVIGTASSVRGSLNTVQGSGGAVTIDIKKNDVSIFVTKLTFDNGEITTVTASTPPTFVGGSTMSIAADDVLTFFVTQVNDATNKGLKIMLIGTLP